ncbi:MAG TPA: hypothetical protein VN132_03325, partial [Bdellovibrio sp.]|nr:hypothetical protein [Bdellovibrio sp.]
MTKMRKLSQQDIVEESIRAEIYSVERLEEYAEFLSENLNVSDIKKTGKPLLKRMRENGDQLFQAYQVLTGALSEKETISPAAEWLVDNFHIIEDQLREIRNDLPKSYYEELPKLSQGSLQDFPRVYALALALVAHTDSHLEVETIRRFIRAFQKKISLSMGELWAVPITLRLVLLENMRRVSLRVVWDRQLRKEADQLVDAIIENVHGPSRFQKLVNEIPRHCELPLEIQCSFVAQMAARLRDPEQEISAATERLDAAIRHRGFSTADIVDFEHQHQAANQITIANIIGSMRLISNIDWQVFFESVSIVDELLSQDPSSDYAKMDFASRDKYRHSIERIGKKTKTPEKEIALKVLQLAKEGAEKHVGYFLVARGVLTLEKLLKYQPTLREMLSRFFILHPTSTYLFSIITTTFIMLAPGVSYAKWAGASSWQIFIVMLLGLIPCAELGVSMVNFLLAHLIKPRPLPKIDLTAGVP